MGEITKIVKNIPWKYSQGYDEIPTKLLNIGMPFIIMKQISDQFLSCYPFLRLSRKLCIRD
jgi:hypothetical protein